MKHELNIDAFECDADQKHILENAKHLYLNDAEMMEHFMYLHLRHQLKSSDYGLDAENDFLKRKFEKFKNDCNDFDKMDCQKSYIKLKAFKPEEINKEKLNKLLCDPSSPPVVIKGFMSDTKAVKTWSHSYLIENFGDVELVAMDYSKQQHEVTEKNIGFTGGAKKLTAKYILENQLDPKSKDTFYINNSVEFFNTHPELLNEVEAHKLNNIIEDLANPLFPQLFIGNIKTWGTDWHINNDVSATFGINGTKRWFFLDPMHAYALKVIPTPHTPAGMFTESFIGGQTSIRYDMDYHKVHNPVYAHVPKYYYDQEPGDVIFFPKWWPHSIINQSPLTIMMNQRYTEVNLEENKKSFDSAIRMPLYESMLRSDPRYRDYNFQVYQSLQNKEIIDDKIYFGRK